MIKEIGLFIFIIILINSKLIGQDFGFILIFQDVIGNTDTLSLGYDIDATDSIDIEFGEVNIISSEIDSIFDVRISDEWNARFWKHDSIGNYHLKKQIIGGICGTGNAISIDIKCKNWPVTAKWDNSLFNDTCRSGSVLTSVPPGGWWDVGSPSDLYRAELKNENIVTFSANWDENINENYAYINENQDTISVFWIVFSNLSFLTIDIQNIRFQNEIVLYPNPSSDKLLISGILIEQIEQIKLFDLSGKEQMINWNSQIIDLNNLSQGVYFLQLRLKDKFLITKKLIKN